jgi:hypothetical protein
LHSNVAFFNAEYIEGRYSFDPSDKFLTLYLNTEPDTGSQSEWRIRLKNGLKGLKEYIEAEGNPSELKQYDQLQKKNRKSSA